MVVHERLTEKDFKIVHYIFDHMGDTGGFVYPKEIAKAVGVEHIDVIIPLRKLEAKGIIRTRINGMEGLFVDILKEYEIED